MSSIRSVGALRRAALAVVCAASFASVAFAGPNPPSQPKPPQQIQPQQHVDAQGRRIPKVQIAILLDNSGSMEGLINQARTEIWKVVNEFATAKQNGVAPRLELALYEYGDGVKRLQPFTTELDRVSEKLFGMSIHGGDEYCGQVILSATNELEWSGDPDDLKLIYIAGNEPFTQGPVKPGTAIEAAKRKGITVNPIVCGGDDPTWRAGATVAGGDYLVIDHNSVVATVAAPQDAEITRLGQELNKTYLGYGAQGAASAVRQREEDKKAAAAAPAAIVTRSVSKSVQQYDNSGWDLVDGTRRGGVKVEKMADDDLPAEMRGMNEQQKRDYVAQKAKERTDIQAKIQALNAERNEFLAKEAKKNAGKGEATLDAAMVGSARKQAEKKAFSF
jgi:von Willebrand factor type A domain-containing protein